MIKARTKQEICSLLARPFLHDGDSLYKALEGPAKIIKSAIQMLIGLWALYELGRQFYWSRAHPSCAPGGHHGFCYGIPQSYDVLNLTGDALAAAAAVELVYTLFTKGPDEALDPLMLGLSAAALLSLGSVTGFKVSDGVTLILYSAALAILFIIKKYLAEKPLRQSHDYSRPSPPDRDDEETEERERTIPQARQDSDALPLDS